MKHFDVKKLTKLISNITIKHHKQDAAKAQIEFIVGCDDISIIVLTGPTGAGKSTLLRQFAKEYLESQKEEMAADPSLRPVAYVLATASGHRSFDWKSLYKQTLINFADPFAATRERRNDGRQPSLVLPGENSSSAIMREQLQAEFLAHGTKLWIIDEAQHVLGGGKTGKPGHQYDILKSLAQTAGAQLILCGPYDLPTSVSHSGQLSRRTARVSLNRYRYTKEELRVFASAATQILKLLPTVMSYPSVTTNRRFFYLRTLGCVGIFKDWAAKTYFLAMGRGATEMTLQDFTDTAMTPRQLATINEEIVQGELEYGDIAAEPSKELMRSILTGATLVHDETAVGTPKRSSDTAKAKMPPLFKPFERAPGRDSVGGGPLT